ncbi:MAG TPA: Nif11-like leader peptide family natural product precursor [Oculatellaceae cyanobacterium]|jgi:predicted ribosomally synthesized peptide with nif11-like leader
MSNESAKKFLADAAHNMVLREKFKPVTNPQEFINTVEELGYSFTTEELKDVVKECSEGVVIRRKTGVWQWLRTINWV